MANFQRRLHLPTLLKKKSFFLLGPRSVGKTYLIGQQLPGVKVYDLLDTETFGRLTRRPALLGEEWSPSDKIVIIDEVQRLPLLLNEVQKLIQHKRVTFLLTGSSARKLTRGGANLLGGRAWMASLFPLCFPEIPDFDLVRYFNQGGLPEIYPSVDYEEALRNYADLYLREEIQAEALTRNLGGFARFLDVMGVQNGEELHYQGLSSDTGIPVRTVQNYVQILEDTLLGFTVPAFQLTRKRKAISRSKFFLFDIGVVNSLARRGRIRPQSELFGRCFEHFLFLELRAYLGYRRLDKPLEYWRSKSGFEVDCVIGTDWALEFKSTNLVQDRHVKGLKALMEEKKIRRYGVVSLDPSNRTISGISVFPWKAFLTDLWDDKII